MKLDIETYLAANGAGKESWAVRAAARITELTSRLAEKESDWRYLAEGIRIAEGQLARGSHFDARDTLSIYSGHYLTCAWWATGGECDCGGRQ